MSKPTSVIVYTLVIPTGYNITQVAGPDGPRLVATRAEVVEGDPVEALDKANPRTIAEDVSNSHPLTGATIVSLPDRREEGTAHESS